jgi:hypothetical protein
MVELTPTGVIQLRWTHDIQIKKATKKAGGYNYNDMHINDKNFIKCKL